MKKPLTLIMEIVLHRRLIVNHNGYGFAATLCDCYPSRYGYKGHLLLDRNEYYADDGKASRRYFRGAKRRKLC